MTRDERLDLDREFLGAEYQIGHTYGADGSPWVAAVRLIRLNLERELTARERTLFAQGWKEGCRDRAEWLRDMEQGADVAPVSALCDLPL